MTIDNDELVRLASELAALPVTSIMAVHTRKSGNQLHTADWKDWEVGSKEYNALGNGQHLIVVPTKDFRHFINTEEPDRRQAGVQHGGGKGRDFLWYHVDRLKKIPNARYWVNP